MQSQSGFRRATLSNQVGTNSGPSKPPACEFFNVSFGHCCALPHTRDREAHGRGWSEDDYHTVVTISIVAGEIGDPSPCKIHNMFVLTVPTDEGKHPYSARRT